MLSACNMGDSYFVQLVANPLAVLGHSGPACPCSSFQEGLEVKVLKLWRMPIPSHWVRFGMGGLQPAQADHDRIPGQAFEFKCMVLRQLLPKAFNIQAVLALHLACLGLAAAAQTTTVAYPDCAPEGALEG